MIRGQSRLEKARSVRSYVRGNVHLNDDSLFDRLSIRWSEKGWNSPHVACTRYPWFILCILGLFDLPARRSRIGWHRDQNVTYDYGFHLAGINQKISETHSRKVTNGSSNLLLLEMEAASVECSLEGRSFSPLVGRLLQRNLKHAVCLVK